MGKFAQAGPKVNHSGGTNRRKGECPKCGGSYALRETDGKVMTHGGGCFGSGQSPVKPVKLAVVRARRSE